MGESSGGPPLVESPSLFLNTDLVFPFTAVMTSRHELSLQRGRWRGLVDQSDGQLDGSQHGVEWRG